MIENALRGMSKLQKINYLTLLYDEVIPICLSALWKIFPNLIEFVTYSIDAIEADIDAVEVISIERIVLLCGDISPPQILSKMPKLNEIILNKWMMSPDNISKVTGRCKQFLPQKCRLTVRKIVFHSLSCLQSPLYCLKCP